MRTFTFSHEWHGQDWHGLATATYDLIGQESDLLWKREKIARIRLTNVTPEPDGKGTVNVHFECEVVGEVDEGAVDKLLVLGMIRDISVPP